MPVAKGGPFFLARKPGPWAAQRNLGWQTRKKAGRSPKVVLWAGEYYRFALGPGLAKGAELSRANVFDLLGQARKRRAVGCLQAIVGGNTSERYKLDFGHSATAVA